MREIFFGEAITEAMREEMRRDPRVFLMGEDVAQGYGGGIFGISKGLAAEFGEERVVETPICESTIAGAAVGAAIVGMRPISEIMFADFLTLASDQIVNSAAKMQYHYSGKIPLPIVFRIPFGAGRGTGAHHSQSMEAWVMHVPGLKVVIPSTPFDAKGLLKASIRDDNPVVFFEHKFLYRSLKGQVPEEEYVVPLGVADVKREGRDLTIIATGMMVSRSLTAAEALSREGIEAEVIDPRTLLPLDKATFIESVKKTGRVLIVHEAPLTGGPGGEIAAILAEDAFDHLEAPIKRIGAPFVPIPANPMLESAYLPKAEEIAGKARDLVNW
jgi:pyruvate/2-oxoglutarate/acetoin dehydrogenase E1 component